MKTEAEHVHETPGIQQHSRRYIEMAFSYDRDQTVRNPNGHGKKTGVCGDTVEMFLIVENDRIRHLFHKTDGCINTRACANTVAVLSEGKTIDDAWEITPEDVVQFLETLPENETHCAELAIGAFYLALADYRQHQKTPWKQLYKPSF